MTLIPAPYILGYNQSILNLNYLSQFYNCWSWKKILDLRGVICDKVLSLLMVPNYVFSIKRAWKSLRDCDPNMFWNKLVWHSKIIHRHSFTLWLAIRRRLCTQDKQVAMGLLQELKFVFYGWVKRILTIYFSKSSWYNL